ncbi:stage II sporulation protein E [Oceanidesulfovibrio marinus]|uniref:Stage II sporulation protein E n=2 Tax=Oceanidesulfovibrio marinus TaxID=370038 RepID=A0A6P1ZHE9_9BACT|nr:stage II sporulation protein E [Oceanidesulfovibrio marinus]
MGVVHTACCLSCHVVYHGSLVHYLRGGTMRHVGSYRAAAYYLFTVGVISVYGGQVCPFLVTLSVGELALIVAVFLGIVQILRWPLMKLVVDAQPPMKQPGRQFFLDMALYVAAALGMAAYNWLTMGFPFAGSGGKLVLGVFTVGLFASIDLSLERERALVRFALQNGLRSLASREFSPLTRKFFLLATVVMLLFAAIVTLVILGDLLWLGQAGFSAETLAMFQRSVLIEIAFVMGVLMLLVVNLIYSYSRNLNLFFNSQTSALEKVSLGDLDVFVPVTTNDEFGFIADHTNSMIDKLRDRLRLQQAMVVAQQIQQKLLPSGVPEMPGIELAAACIYSDETGGDYYDFIESADPDGGSLCVIVGDVTGHGVGAALLMATIRAFIRMRLSMADGLAASLHDVNRLVEIDAGETGNFMTLFGLMIHKQSGRLRWVTAGHDAALVYDTRSGSFSELGGKGVPLGVVEDTRYEERERPALEAGEVVVLATDGVWETQNPAGEMYGKQRFRQCIAANAQHGPRQMLDAVVRDVAGFRGSNQPADDVTMICIRGLDR